MSFYQPQSDDQNTFFSYLLVIAVVLLSFMIGNVFSEYLANTIGGFSLLHIHQGINKNLILVFSILPFFFVVIASLLSVKFLLKRPVLTALTSRTSFSWGRFAFSGLSWLLILFFLLLISVMKGDPVIVQFDAANFLPLLLIALTMLPFQTLAEDLFFRSILFQGLSKLRLHPIAAAFISAVLFGWAHSSNPEVQVLGYSVLIYYTMTGLFLALLTHFDNGLELGLGYHFMNNFFGLVVLTTNWQSFQTDALFLDKSQPQFGFATILIVAIIQPLLFWIFYKKYQWRLK